LRPYDEFKHGLVTPGFLSEKYIVEYYLIGLRTARKRLNFNIKINDPTIASPRLLEGRHHFQAGHIGIVHRD